MSTPTSSGNDLVDLDRGVTGATFATERQPSPTFKNSGKAETAEAAVTAAMAASIPVQQQNEDPVLLAHTTASHPLPIAEGGGDGRPEDGAGDVETAMHHRDSREGLDPAIVAVQDSTAAHSSPMAPLGQNGRGPGAYRIAGIAQWSHVSIQSDTTTPDARVAPPHPVPRDTSTFLAQADLIEEPATNPWRSRQAGILIVVVVVVALVVGLSVGLVHKPVPSVVYVAAPTPTDFPTASPTQAPTPALVRMLLDVLPNHTLERLSDPNSYQSKAYQWVTEQDFVSRREYPEDRALKRATHRFALASLYFSTGGKDAWSSNSHWLDVNLTECNWDYCKCTTGDGFLSSLNAEVNGGPIPREVGLLQSLSEFTAVDFQGLLPTELGLLNLLTYLDIRGTGLTGVIPTELGWLTQLTRLAVYETSLTGPVPTELGFLTGLTTISLYNNHLNRSLPTEVGHLTALDYLDISGNALTGTIPTHLGFLVHLTQLHLRGGDPGGGRLNGSVPTELGELTQLTLLSLLNNLLWGTIPLELTRLSKLTKLDLSDNDLTGLLPTELGDMTRLNKLAVNTNKIGGPIPTQLGKLWSLENLNLQHNELTGPIPAGLGSLQNLRSMFLYDNQLSGSFPFDLCTLLLNTTNSLQVRVDCREVSSSEYCGCSCYDDYDDNV